VCSGARIPRLLLGTALFAVGLQTAIPRVLRGQESGGLSTGAQVRLALRDRPDHWLVGIVVGQSGDSLRLNERGSHTLLAVPTERLAALQVSRGRRSHATLGALLGLTAGAAFGVIATAADPAINTDARGYAVAAGFFGAMGLGAGALVGWAVRSERWESWPPLPISRQRIPHSAGPHPALSLSLQF
jgi:hypothetical protein